MRFLRTLETNNLTFCDAASKITYRRIVTGRFPVLKIDCVSVNVVPCRIMIRSTIGDGPTMNDRGSVPKETCS